MDMSKILSSAGATALSVAFPAAAPFVLGAVNAFLSDEDKLPENATGAMVSSRIEALSGEEKTRIYGMQFDLEKTKVTESYATLRMMLDADTKNPHTTRPKIAYQSFQVIGASNIMIAFAIAYQIIEGNVDIATITLPLAALLSPLVILLHAYFAILRDEKASTYRGTPASTGFLSGLLRK